jgi:hypothetical protein
MNGYWRIDEEILRWSQGAAGLQALARCSGNADRRPLTADREGIPMRRGAAPDMKSCLGTLDRDEILSSVFRRSHRHGFAVRHGQG